MKVRALRTGHYPDINVINGETQLDWRRRRGDDQLGAGAGDVFTLRPYQITVVNVKTQRVEMEADGRTPKMRTLTVEEQFSPRWMEVVEETIPERITPAQATLDHVTHEILQEKRGQRLRRAQA